MSRETRRRALGVTLLLVVTVGAEAADHPPLVDTARTRCEVCHPDQNTGPVVHTIVSDCQACHEFIKVDKGMTVKLVDGQPALCLACHAELEPAAAGALQASHYPVGEDCLACHDPHSSTELYLLTRGVPALCFDCHDGESTREAHGVAVGRSNCMACHLPHGSDRKGMLADGDSHAPFADRSCVACHRRGLSARARGDASKICYACHESEAFEGKVVHAAVSEGECLACHNPLFSSHPGLVRHARQALCLTCHKEIGHKLARATVHPVVPDSCDTCHATHVGDNPFLLLERPTVLCGSCHDPDDAGLRSAHLESDLTLLDCATCHDGHGSSERSLIADASVHPPFSDAACETCHGGSASELIANGGSELCYACHADIQEIADGSAVQHPAMDAAECRDCHTPHATRNRKLKKNPRGTICLTCHDDKRATSVEFQHGAISRIGCESCHQPHGGSKTAMVRADIDELCLGCHDRSRWTSTPDADSTILLARFVVPERTASEIPTFTLEDGSNGHPVSGHRTLGTVTDAEREMLHSSVNSDSEIHCVTCHDPHKGVVRELMTDGRTEVCSICHPK